MRDAVIGCLVSCFLIACTNPREKFDAFSERTEGTPGHAADGGLAVTGDAGGPANVDGDAAQAGLPDMTGTYLLGLESPLNVGSPFLFVVDAQMIYGAGGRTATLDVSFTGINPDTKMPVEGAPLRARGVSVALDGTFTIPLTGVIPALANPLRTGNDVEVDVSVQAHIQTVDAFCGDVTGMILRPIELPLENATVGAIRINRGVVGDALPEPIVGCEPPGGA
jgi:hypothetical protein